MRRLLTLLAVPALLAACEENPLMLEEHEEELTVELTVDPSHVHTLSPVTFTVAVKDDHGMFVTDFDTLRVERRTAGTETWRAINLELDGSVYKGTYVFTSSGEYDLRVAGMRRGGSHLEVLHEMAEHLEVGRAHVEVGGYRVEFENFPGHVHEGDTAAVKFWVKQAERDAAGNRPPVTGLAAEIHCTDADGAMEEHRAAESEPGVYQATHRFREHGTAKAGIHFERGGAGVLAEFELSVSEKH